MVADTPHRRAMDDVETVARAIYDADYANEPWRKFDTLDDDDKTQYRFVAQAAIDSLGLTEMIQPYPYEEATMIIDGEPAWHHRRCLRTTWIELD